MSVDVAPLSVFVLSIGVPNRLEKHTGSLQSGTCVTIHNDPVNQCYTHTSIVFTTAGRFDNNHQPASKRWKSSEKTW